MIAVSGRYLTAPRLKPLPVLGQLQTFNLTNELGRPVTLNSIKGQVGVFNTIFSRCPGQCHRLSQQMAAVQKRLPPKAHLYSFTTDPEFDSPPVLLAYGKRYGSDSERWSFLTGAKSEVYRVAISNLLFTVTENADKNARLEDLFIHSVNFMLTDRMGRLRAVVNGDEPGAEEKILNLTGRLLAEPQ